MSVSLHPRVTELLVSRICHDLISPVGAISNGIELVQEMGEDAGEEAWTLMSDSTDRATSRLQCFRLAYGSAGSESLIGLSDIEKVFREWLVKGHLELEWNIDEEPEDLPKGALKALIDILLLSEECNPGDGSVSVQLLDSGNGFKVVANGSKVGFRERGDEALDGSISVEDITPRSVHAYITGQYAAHYGLKISYEQKGSENITFNISF